MRKWRGVVCAVLAAVSALVNGVAEASAQEPQVEDRIDLFFDCQAPDCRDADYFRRELPFVNWVVDRQVADVHVLVTSVTTGGGGRFYTLAFLGLGDFEGDDAELTLATPADATSDDARSGIAARTRLGLVRYAQGTAVASRLLVTYDQPEDSGLGRGPADGPGAVSPSDAARRAARDCARRAASCSARSSPR